MELSLRARVRAGDQDAFGVLFEEHARAVYNHAFRVTGNWSTAEEVVSLTFLEAWRLRGTIRPEGGSLLPWLLGIALNVARNVSRAARRHQAAMSRLPAASDVPDFADEIAGRIDDAARLDGVRTALSGLRRGEREVLALCAWSGLNYAEAAEARGVPVGTVRSRLSRARRKLQSSAATAQRDPGGREPGRASEQVDGDRENAMNDHDSRREREIAELPRLLPVPDGRDLPAGRQQILKEHLMTELRRTDAPGQASRRPAPGHRGKRPWRLAAAAAAGVLAVALAAAAIAVANGRILHARPSAPSGGPARTGTPATAAALLVKIANAAAGQPSPAVRDSEFMYIRSKVAYEVDTIVNGHETSTMEKPHERQVWLPVANLCVTGLLIEDGSRTPLSPFPIVNGKVERNPPGNEPQPAFRCPSEGHLGDATYRLLQSLPTNPAALLTYLKAGKKWTNDPPSTEIGDLIREAIIPPAVAAALYRVAALLPGATLIPDVTNAVGRPGIGIAWTSPGGQYRNVWIFDRTSLQYIGERDYNVRTGVVNGESAILQRAFVGQAGQRP